MRLLTSNLYLFLVVGLPLVLASFLRVWFVRPVWQLLVPGVILLALVGIGTTLVAVSPPGEEMTIDQVITPKPTPVATTHLQRLRSAWNSVAEADWPVAETLADMSEVAYLPPVDADPLFRLMGFTEIIPIVASSMIGYVASNEDVTVIVFRGTDSGEVSDWMANLGRSAYETPYGPIHKGFFDSYQSLQPQIMTVLRNKSPKHLWVTGHSLGGALALVCAFDLIDYQQMRIDGLITFGQPMVARQKLAEHLDSRLFGQYAHFVNNDDIVPRVPPSHSHCGSLVWFSGTLIKRSKPKHQTYGAVGAQEDTATEKEAVEIDEIPPLTETQFQEIQSKMKVEESLPPDLPKGQIPVGASHPMVDDHSMELYVQKVRTLLGIKIEE